MPHRVARGLSQGRQHREDREEEKRDREREKREEEQRKRDLKRHTKDRKEDRDRRDRGYLQKYHGVDRPRGLRQNLTHGRQL